jgi:hypothetical protein
MDNKIKAALISIARIDDPREHREYGYWHRHDHLPEVWARPGVALAQRCVAPPALLRARVSDAGDLAGAQYFTYYLLTEPLDAILSMFAGGNRALVDAGRMRLLRTPSSGGIFRLRKAYASPRGVVSAAAVPFLPHAGMFVSVHDVDPAAREEVERYYDDIHVPDMLTVRHVTGCYWFDAWADAPVVNVARPPAGRAVRIFFLDGDPQEMVLDLLWRAAQWQAAGRIRDFGDALRKLLSGPFQPVSAASCEEFG